MNKAITILVYHDSEMRKQAFKALLAKGYAVEVRGCKLIVYPALRVA